MALLPDTVMVTVPDRKVTIPVKAVSVWPGCSSREATVVCISGECVSATGRLSQDTKKDTLISSTMITGILRLVVIIDSWIE